MKKVFGIGAVVFLLISAFTYSNEFVEVTTAEESSNGLEWHTDLKKAHDLSQKTGKPIFGFFTGSDWCGWCIKLQKEVFAKEEFVTWANDKVILLELDFPKRTAQPDDLKIQNRNLQQALGVRGYPTVWLFNSSVNDKGVFNIERIGSLGYPSGAVKGKEEVKFISSANMLLKKSTTASATSAN